MADSNSDTQQAVSRRLPTGTVVFLFTDVEGSTRRWESDQVRMSRALQLHDETLRFAIESHGGYVFKTVGDGFCSAFDRLTDAAFAAQTIVKQLGSDTFDTVGKLGVRIAIHVGEAYERDGDYFGPTVNRIARLLQIGHPGQILFSAAAAESFRPSIPANFSLKNLEEHRLKDLARPERVFQLLAPGLDADFLPLRSLGTIAENNLPLQPTALIGRESVVADVRKLLKMNRLVTLTGSGGVGKTRVALQVGAEMLDEADDGVWFVDLASTNDPARVATVVSSAMRLELSRERPPLDALINYLEKRRLLIVLDNCEHVIGEAARVTESILMRCKAVTLLATSRESLNISGEHVYWMPSLDVPPKQSARTVEALRYGSVMLFAERARSVNASFTMNDETTPFISEICRRLDGIALAIELAAARTDLLQPRELVMQLDKRFELLTAGRRTALRRQQTLRATIDWSFDLLGEREQRLFRRLAIFSDGWTLEAAEAVCSDEALHASDILDGLSSLVTKSLVITTPHRDRTRFRFLESTRLYASEKLPVAERTCIAHAHLGWVLRLTEDAFLQRGKIPLLKWLSTIEPEIENIREALRFADVAEISPATTGRIVGALAPFWFVAGLLHEGRQRIESALTSLNECVDAPIVARLSLGLAQLKPGSVGRDAALRAIAIFHALGDWRNEVRGQGTLAWVFLRMGNLLEAETTVERALTAWRDRAETNTYDYACDLDTCATILMYTGRRDRARAHFQEAADVFATLGEDEGAAISRFNLAELEFAAGETTRALAFAVEAIVSLRKQQSLGRLVVALTNAAGYRLALGDIAGARENAREVLLLARRFQTEMIPYAAEHLAAIAAQKGDVNRAARLFGYVEASYRKMNVERGATELRSFEIISLALASSLTQGRLETLLSEGEQLTEGAVITEALDV